MGMESIGYPSASILYPCVYFNLCSNEESAQALLALFCLFKLSTCALTKAPCQFSLFLFCVWIIMAGAARAAGDAIVFGAVLRAAPFCVLPAVLVALAY
jgi:hypothetical protein